jgi:hypothetical protein
MESARIADRERQQAYTLRRQYELYSQESPEKRSQVIAKIQYEPPSKKQYSIEQSSGGMIDRVVHRMLDHETDAAQASLGEISRENYRFQLAGEEACGNLRCFVLNIEPFQERKDTIRGRVWVDSDSYRIMRVVGISAKTPSFMIRKVDVQLEYGMVEGMWLQRVTRAVADVRFKGKYEMLSRAIGCEVARANSREGNRTVAMRERTRRDRATAQQRTEAATGLFLPTR